MALDQMLVEIRTAPASSLLPDLPVGEHPFADDIAWAQGDITKSADGMTPESMGQAYYEALLVNRNAAWTDWLAKRTCTVRARYYSRSAPRIWRARIRCRACSKKRD